MSILAGFDISDIHGKDRSSARLGLYGNRPVVSAHDLINDWETKAGPVSELGIERNEQLLDLVFLYTSSGVLELDSSGSAARLQPNGECASVRHSSEGVRREIVKHLPHHAAVHRARNGRESCFDGVARFQLRTVPHQTDRFRNQNGKLEG